MFEKLYKQLLVKDAVDVHISGASVLHVNSADLIRNSGAQKQIEAMTRIAEKISKSDEKRSVAAQR